MLPTPTAQNAKHGVATPWEHENRPDHLHVIAAASASLWPTPHANCGNGTGASGRDGGLKIQTAVADTIWPTPRAEGFDAGRHRGRTDSLHSAVKEATGTGLYPTPRASEWKGSGSADSATTQVWKDKHYLTGVVREDDAGQVADDAVRRSLRLHARWVQRMMGFPDRWLDVDDPMPAPLMDDRWRGDPLAAFGPDWEDGVPRVAVGEEQRAAKLRALGNAVVPQVPFVLLSAIREQMREEDALASAEARKGDA